MIVLIPMAFLYRLAPAGSPLFLIGMGLGVFQLAAFYGPTFSTVQELSPPGARATVTAFYILCLNVLGLGVGITGAGWVIDYLRSSGVAEPYTAANLIFVGISALSIPAFFLAGKWSKGDRARIEAAG